MKKFLILMFMISSMASYAQKTNLITVNTVKPLKGQKMAFEAAYKQHVAKFHKATENVNVYEIMSGPNAGSYHLVNGGRTFADFDNVRPDAAAHNLDLDKTFFPLLETTMNGTYSINDSLSLRTDVVAEKFLMTIRHLKQDVNQNDLRKEWARTSKINAKMTGVGWANVSYTFFEQLWDGSDQTQVVSRPLKDGFKALETNFYGERPAGSPSFRDEYVKAYGHTDWDNRVKLLEGSIVKTEQYIMRLRKDLSTGQ